MAEIGLSVAAKTAEYTVNPIARQFGYMWDYKSNFQNLEKQVQKLQSRRDMVQHSIDDATKNGEEIEQHVVNWLDSVNMMIDEAEEIITDNNQANMRCFKRWCPDLKKRYQHSKKAAVKAKDVSELEKEGKFDRISYRSNPKETWHPSCKLYEDFESRRSTVDDILNELRHPGVNMVGVHGMGGIGKTTLAREVGNQAEEQKLFDAVVFVEISEKPDIRKIQEAIADKLGLEFRESSESGRAMILCERLKKESKLLLILDNIWKGLELDKVGIPFGNDHPGCKLLLTARSIDVLSNDMSSQRNFPIDGLKEKEAWDLFKKAAGACIEQDNLQSLASDVAQRCGGLPIAIVTIAKALKDKPVHAWRNALRELKRPSSENLEGSVTTEAYSCIRLSYNHLETDELKSTFLLCSTMVFASDASVEELLRYGMGLRLFKTVYTMEEARDRVNTLVQHLKESSLLLDHPDNDRFSIHDVVRDVGRAIASKDHNKIIVIDIPRELNDKNIMKNCTSLSLYDITELPKEEFDCRTLEFLYMESNNYSSEIPDNFFSGMPNLRVLHLKIMGLSLLPPSLGCLVNLRILCLDCDLLSDIGFIEDMKDLDILVLSCDAIKQLPKEVGQLTQLRVLDLSRGFGLEIIPPNTISRLTKLEELYMPSGFNQWQAERVYMGRSNVSLEELKDLSQLTTLQIWIEDAKIVPKGLFSQKLQRYQIHIGPNRWNYSGWEKTSRLLELEYDDSIYVENIVVKQLKGIEELRLIGKQGVKNVLDEKNIDDFPQLKHCDVQGDSDLVYIVDSSKQSQPCEAFPRLETFSLRNVISLEKICHGQLMPNSFCRLRNIKVEHCDKLKNFFSLSIASHLSQLQEIKVTDCENMEEFFTMGRRNEVIVLDQLQFLCLKNLPKLRRFCSEVEVASSSDHERQMLDTPMPFFDGKVEFPNLKTLELRKMNVDKIWHNQLSSMSSCFPNLTDLVISNCCNLKYIFASSTLRSFVQLQCLEIRNCEVLEEIIRIDDLKYNVELLSLRELSVRGCREMKAVVFGDKDFCSGNIYNINLPSLEMFYVFECFKMNIFSSAVASTPMLRKINLDFTIYDCEGDVNTTIQHIQHMHENENGDAWSLGDVKPRMTEESNDKSKIWKLTEINEPSQCRSLRLPENLIATKISRLIFTNSGNAILALASNAIHLLWKWQRSDRNSSGKATASVSPQLWQPPSGILMTNDVTDSNPEEAVPCFALSKNDCYLISASGGKISLFNMMTFKTMTTFMPPPPAATFLAFHPQDNNIIAIGMDDYTIQIYNVSVDEVKSKLKGHSKRITGLAFSHVLNVLVSFGADAQLCVWNCDGWEKQKNRFLQIPAGRTPTAQSDTRVQFHQDQIHFLVVLQTQLAIFETTKLECVKQWAPRESSAPITHATFSCDSQLVYASFLDATVCVYSAVNLRLCCRINPTAYLPSNVSGSNVHPLVIAAHPQEPNQLALGLSDGGVHVFEPLESEGKWGVPPPVENGSASSVPAAPSVGASGSEQAQR